MRVHVVERFVSSPVPVVSRLGVNSDPQRKADSPTLKQKHGALSRPEFADDQSEAAACSAYNSFVIGSPSWATWNGLPVGEWTILPSGRPNAVAIVALRSAGATPSSSTFIPAASDLP